MTVTQMHVTQGSASNRTKTLDAERPYTDLVSKALGINLAVSIRGFGHIPV